MKFQTRMEKNISRMEKRLGLPTAPLQTGDFLEFAPNAPASIAAQRVNREQQTQIDDVRDGFSDVVFNLLHPSRPFSFLPCVLALPEKIVDWPALKFFQRILLDLLSDHGFLFWEVYPTATGQNSILDFVGMIDKGKQNTSGHQELWTETKMISYLLNELDVQYRQIVLLDSILLNMEHSVAKDVAPCAGETFQFRSCIANVVDTVLQKGFEAKGPFYYEERLVSFCKDNFHFTEEQLCRSIPVEDILKLRYADKPLNSLGGALSVLSNLCNELVCELNEQKVHLAPTASKETYKQYKDYCSTREQLRLELQPNPVLFYSSKWLFQDIEENLVSWYQHVDSEKRDLMKIHTPTEEDIDFEDQTVRINGKVSADKNKNLPQYFDFSWNELELEQVKDQKYNQIRQQLLDVFKQYLGRCDKHMAAAPKQAEEIINNILAISFMDTFSLDCVDESDTAEESMESSISLAPVISYVIFHHCHKQIATGTLNKFSMKILTSQTEPAKTFEDIVNDLILFSELRSAYGQYYGEKYTEKVGNLWNAAFLVYSGHQKLYGNPNLFHSIESVIGTDRMPRIYCFDQIMRCLNANRVSLTHSAVARTGNPQFPPTPNNISSEALKYFREKLEADCNNNSEPLLEQYKDFLMKPYSHEGINEFLNGGLKQLFPTPKDMSECEYQKMLCTQHGLYSQNGVSYRVSYTEALLKAALEFSLRNMLEEECAHRLYGWLTDYIDLLCKDVDI